MTSSTAGPNSSLAFAHVDGRAGLPLRERPLQDAHAPVGQRRPQCRPPADERLPVEELGNGGAHTGLHGRGAVRGSADKEEGRRAVRPGVQPGLDEPVLLLDGMQVPDVQEKPKIPVLGVEPVRQTPTGEQPGHRRIRDRGVAGAGNEGREPFRDLRAPRPGGGGELREVRGEIVSAGPGRDGHQETGTGDQPVRDEDAVQVGADRPGRCVLRMKRKAGVTLGRRAVRIGRHGERQTGAAAASRRPRTGCSGSCADVRSARTAARPCRRAPVPGPGEPHRRRSPDRWRAQGGSADVPGPCRRVPPGARRVGAATERGAARKKVPGARGAGQPTRLRPSGR